MKFFTWDIGLPKECGEDGGKGTARADAYLLDWSEDGAEKTRPAVVICPGGGYRTLSPREGEPVAMQYLSMGYHVFVLRYSVAPERFPTALWQLALLTAQIRDNSRQWLVDPEKIVVSGFSAGGHLACSLGAFWNREFVYGPLRREKEEIRPNAMLLSYPVITSGPYCHKGSFEKLLGEEADNKEKRHLVSLEYQVGPHTPKTFVWHTATDDSVPARNSLLLAENLIKSGVNVELHIFPTGCHGLSLATEDTCKGLEKMVVPQCQSWITLAREWLKTI